MSATPVRTAILQPVRAELCFSFTCWCSFHYSHPWDQPGSFPPPAQSAGLLTATRRTYCHFHCYHFIFITYLYDDLHIEWRNGILRGDFILMHTSKYWPLIPHKMKYFIVAGHIQKALIWKIYTAWVCEKFKVSLWHHEWQIPHGEIVPAQNIRNILCICYVGYVPTVYMKHKQNSHWVLC